MVKEVNGSAVCLFNCVSFSVPTVHLLYFKAVPYGCAPMMELGEVVESNVIINLTSFWCCVISEVI